MNKSLSVALAAAALVFLGAGCTASALAPTPQAGPDAIEHPIPATRSATAPDEISTGELHVAWSVPVPIDPVDVFTESYEAFRGYDASATDSAPLYLNPRNYRQVGVIKDGTYTGGKLAIIDVSIRCSMGGSASPFHFILPKNGKPVLLARHSPEPDFDQSEPDCQDFDASKLVIDRTAEAPELHLPERLVRGTEVFSMVQSGFWGSPALQVGTPPLDLDHKKIAFTDPGVGNVFMDSDDGTKNVFPQYGFYVAAPDGTIRSYALRPKFYDEKLHVPALTWSDGTRNTKEYWMSRMGGCGAQNFANVVKGVVRADLKPSGTTPQGETIYLLKDTDHQILKDIYASYAPRWEGRDASKDVSYADFIDSKPVFFWYDAFGRLIGFQGTEFMPAAECGKPVIYLYPPKTEDVSVKLAPQGGFTKTEPAYREGWNARATPSGELTDLSDGKSYPYLFWEGRGGLYETPTRGWSVAQKDVHGFLKEKLSQLGLNAKESADFMGFWEPRMQDSPYYFVTFLGNQAMDALAPMEVVPKPDRIIRILMDFKPLAAPIDVRGFRIHTPEREGFTVVEWGGVLR